MELLLIVMFGIVLLIGAFYVLFRFVRYATFQEAKNQQQAEKIDELEAEVARLRAPNGFRAFSREEVELIENAAFTERSALTLLTYAVAQLMEAVGKLEISDDNLGKLRGLDKSYKTGKRNEPK